MQTFCKVGNSYINKDIIDNISSMRVVLSETKTVLSEEEKKQLIENYPYDMKVVEITKENVRNMNCVYVIEKKFYESHEKFIDRFRTHFDCFCNNKLQHYHNWLICNHIYNEVYDDITFFKYKIDFNKSCAKLALEYDKNNVFSFIKYKKSFYKIMWSTQQTNPFEREFDMLKRNSSIIREYTVYHTKLNTLYDELEQQGSIKKEKLLQNIKIIYENVKAVYIKESNDTIQIIKNNADQIFDKVYDTLYHKLDDSGLWDEDITLGVRIVLVDAFIRCKVLEEPNDY